MCEPCTGGEVKIALHVGEHRSMTWILKEVGGVLTLQHDHRQKDGSPNTLTDFGGCTAGALSETRAEFLVDPHSVDIFDRIGIPDPKGRKWAVEVQPTSGIFAYERQRPGHIFRLEFDTKTPIQTAPMAWGW